MSKRKLWIIVLNEFSRLKVGPLVSLNIFGALAVMPRMGMRWVPERSSGNSTVPREEAALLIRCWNAGSHLETLWLSSRHGRHYALG